MANSADPDQLASSTDLDLHCLERQGISRFSRTTWLRVLIRRLEVGGTCYKYPQHMFSQEMKNLSQRTAKATMRLVQP